MMRLRLIIKAVFDLIVVQCPGPNGVALRAKYYRKRMKRLGNNVQIEPGVLIRGLESISIGDNSVIKSGAVLCAGKPKPAAQERRKIIQLANNNEQVEPGALMIGSNCRILYYSVVLAYGGVQLGDNSALGIGSCVFSESHHYRNRSFPGELFVYSGAALPEHQTILRGAVVIEENVGIAADAMLFPGSCVRHDSWVAPRAIVRVNQEVPPYVIAAGDPATAIFDRKADRALS